jgi:hypothetical protein
MNFLANVQDYATHTEKKLEHRDRNIMLQKSVNTNKHNIITTIGYEQECKTKYRNQTKYQPIRLAARSNARTVFARSNIGIVSSNPTRGMDVCLRLFYVCVFLYVGSGLATGWSPCKGPTDFI